MNFLLFVFLFFFFSPPPLFSLLSPLPFFFTSTRKTPCGLVPNSGPWPFLPLPSLFFPFFFPASGLFFLPLGIFSLRSLSPFYLVVSLPQALTVLVLFSFWTWKSFFNLSASMGYRLIFLIFSDSKKGRTVHPLQRISIASERIKFFLITIGWIIML